MNVIRGMLGLGLCCLGLLSTAQAADPKDDKAQEEKRYDNKDLEKLRSKVEKKAPASAPPAPQSLSGESSYSNADLSKLPEPTKLPEAPPESVQTYTNKDLGAAPPAPEPAEEAPADTTAEIDAAKAELDEAQASVDDLEARLRAVRNPFLPRPVLTPEEEEAWKGLNNTERSARVELQLKEARDRLAAAIEKLSTLQPGER